MQVQKNGATIATFTFDADGKRVKSVMGTETILFIGAHYEIKNGNQITKYYMAGATRVAMRTYTIPYNNVNLTYLMGDQLGSTSLAVNATTNEVIETRYKAWGEVRYTTPTKTLPTRNTYTGQYSDSYINLLWYGSRHYDPALGHFIQPDSIIPDPSNPQAYDRYSYVFNNPVNNTDSTGHYPELYAADGPITFIVIGIVIIGAIALGRDVDRRHNTYSSGCTSSLAECFQNNEIKKFSNYEQIDPKDFENMLNVIDSDLSEESRTSIDPARASYDTPFFNGNRFRDRTNPDATVCFENNQCYTQSEVNYVAQGMYSAKTDQSLDDATELVQSWNNNLYGHNASDGELYWLAYGYNWYMNKHVNDQYDKP